MTSGLRVSLACGDYDRTRALTDGRVTIPGVVLDYTPMKSNKIFYRQVRFKEWDVSEMSLGTYLVLESRGRNPFVAIPVFTSRYFRHGFIWVNSSRGIDRPEDLRGKAVGIPDYHMTAAIWIRGFLEDDYGVRPEDIHWFVGGLNEPGTTPRIDVGQMPGLRVTPVDDSRTLNEMLLTGEVDAVVAASYPRAFTDGEPAVKRLFENHVEVELDYYARRRNFPIMHCIALRREIANAHPWLPASLYHAFEQAKQLCIAEMTSTGASSITLPWVLEYVAEIRKILGHDYWPYGLEPNRHDLETLIRYSCRQGLLARNLYVNEIFVPTAPDPPDRST